MIILVFITFYSLVVMCSAPALSTNVKEVHASLNCLGSSCEEVQYQVAECGSQDHSGMSSSQLHG